MNCVVDQCPEAASWNVSERFNCSQLLQYCHLYTYSVYLSTLVSSIAMHAFTIGGPIGLVSYLLMIAALRHMPFNVSSRIYHVSLAAAETLHMIAMSIAGVITIIGYTNDRNYSFVVWFGLVSNGWQIGDAMKITVAALTVCIAVERCIAGSFPFFYRKITTRTMASSMSLLSLAIGCLNLYFIYLGSVTRSPDGIYTFVLDRQTASFDFFLQLITFLKVAFSVVVLLACTILIVRLRRHTKRVIAMSGLSSREQRQHRRLSIFSLWTSVIMIVDHISWAVYKVENSYPITAVGAAAVATLTYDQAMYNSQLTVDIARARVTQALVGVFAHCGRFLVYYAVDKGYRNALKHICCKSSLPPSTNDFAKSVA